MHANRKIGSNFLIPISLSLSLSSMADNKRKKKRGRKKTKLDFRSCFPSFANQTPPPYSNSNSNFNSNNKSNDRNFKRRKFITVSSSGNCNRINDVEFVNKGDPVNNDCDRGRISRLFKAVFFDSFMAKKKINRSSSKSSATSDTSEPSSTTLSTKNTIKSTNHDNNAIHVRESTDMDSSLMSSSCSRTTSSSNLTSSRCSSSNSASQRSSSEPKTSRIDLVDVKPNPVPINPISRSDSLPKPNQTISSKTLVSSNSLPLPKPNPNNHSRDKLKSIGTNRNLVWCLFLLLSLVVLVVYGRIYSILCTSTWFYFVPCRKMKRVNSVNSVKVVDIDSVQYKKRVIMAGLLDRTRNPLR